LILRLTCPECEKDSYSASAEAFKPCPYCGILFSGKYGSEKRKIVRMKKEIPVRFSYKGQKVEATTINFSDKGLSLKIFGTPSLPVGDIMELNIGDAAVRAQIMWFFDNPQTSTAVTGLKIVDENINLLQV
jgi:hypothetical protein